MAKSKAQQALAAGPSKIGAKARAAAGSVKAKQAQSRLGGLWSATRSHPMSTRNGPKAPETDHLRPDQFAGRHHAPSSYKSAKRNAEGGSYGGKHAAELSVHTPKHSGAYDHWRDVAGVIKNGGYAYGRHARSM